MNNEFEKLDAFMRKHTPPMPSWKKAPTPRNENLYWFLRSAFALCLVLVVLGTMAQIQRTQDENTLALSEALSWDVTSDEMPVEFEDTLAWVE